MKAILNINELGGYAEPFAGASYGSFQYFRDTESITNRAQIVILTLECERRCAARDFQVEIFCQEVEQFFGKTVCKVILIT